MASRAKKTKKSKTGNQPETSYNRSILNVQIPKPYMKLASMGDRDLSVRVSGLEVVSEVFKPKISGVGANPIGGFTQVFNRRINPGDPSLFPRLSTIAFAFDRFKLEKMVIRYHCGCPSTTTGAIAFAVLRDSSDPIPASLVELAEFASSSIGTVTAPLQVSYVGDAKEPFLLMSTTGDALDNDRWSGLSRIFIAVDKWVNSNVSLSDGFYGYISLEYTFLLSGLRPAERAVVAGSTATAGLTLAPNQAQYVSPTYQTVRGYWEILKEAKAFYDNWNASLKPRNDQSITAGKGNYQLAVYQPFNAVPPVEMVRFKNGATVTSVRIFEPTETTYVNPEFQTPGVAYAESKEGLRGPEGTGDVIISLIGQSLSDSTAQVQTILQYLWSGVTGVFQSNNTTPFTLNGPYRLALQVLAADARSFASDGRYSISVLE